jgi:hypothetical protein
MLFGALEGMTNAVEQAFSADKINYGAFGDTGYHRADN